MPTGVGIGVGSVVRMDSLPCTPDGARVQVRAHVAYAVFSTLDDLRSESPGKRPRPANPGSGKEPNPPNRDDQLAA